MAGSVDELPLAAAFARGLDVFTRSQAGDADADTIAADDKVAREAEALLRKELPEAEIRIVYLKEVDSSEINLA